MICEAINRKVENDFEEAQEYVIAFDAVRPIYEYNRKWDFDAYRKQAHSVTSLKEEMEQIAEWEKELEMRARQSCGILEVESRKLRTMLIPMTAEKMEALKGLVKDLARAKCKEQLNKYKNRISKLSQRPVHLKDFAAQVEGVEALQAAGEEPLQAHADGRADVPAARPPRGQDHRDDLVQLDELRSFQVQYNEETEASNTYRDERLPEMTQQLDMNIARLNDQLVQISGQLEEGVFVNVAPSRTRRP